MRVKANILMPILSHKCPMLMPVEGRTEKNKMYKQCLSDAQATHAHAHTAMPAHATNSMLSQGRPGMCTLPRHTFACLNGRGIGSYRLVGR